LYYLNSRYYNPVWGRFLNADNYLVIKSGAITESLYEYASNNPINNIDSNGHFLKKAWNWITKTLNSISRKGEKLVNDVCIIAVGALAFAAGRTSTARTMWNSTGVKSKVMTEKNLPGIVNKIQTSSQFQEAIDNIVEEKPNGIIDVDDMDLEFSFNGFNDLGLSLHGSSLWADGTLIDGKGTLSIMITDTYDFKYETNYKKKSFQGKLVTLANNFAFAGQESGYVNNYDIVIKFDYTIN